MTDFRKLGLPQPLLQSLERIKFSTPTPIQAKAIPIALQGRDILGSAQTGTGKTGAFSIPMLAKLMSSPQGGALIMTPTRELAAQVLKAITDLLGRSSDIRTALLIGGDSMFKQLAQLKARPRIIVGTPGRINDHLERRSLRLDQTDYLVLDETDRMLDMGFEVQIERILQHMPKKRQTLLFSATLPPYIVKLAEKYLNKPERIAVGSVNTPIQKIQQEMIRLPASEKYNMLLKQLNHRGGSIIIFVKTKHGADKMATKLEKDGHNAIAIHGDLNQGKRNRVIQAFRDRKHRVLVATDVAARGLDIPHIEHVINYDLPQVAEDYIHRIGRTARAGAEGSAVCFITPEDGSKWRDIHALLNPGEKLPREERGSRPPQGGNKKPKAGKRTSSSGPGWKRKHKPKSEGGYAGGEKREYRGDRKPASRSEPRSEHRSERSFEKRSAPRSERGSEKRFDSRSEGRSERSSERRFDSRSEHRSERKSEPRSERSFEKRSEPRSERKFERSSDRRSETRSEHRPRTRSGEGYEPRRDSKPGGYKPGKSSGHRKGSGGFKKKRSY
jgi:ATP-dependent RNA helicase DeaD